VKKGQSKVNSTYRIEWATANDMIEVHELIKELALYEKAPEQVETTPEELVKDGFEGHPWFRCLVARLPQGNLAGFALFYTNYSTWKGKCLYLEDILVRDAYRGKGVGKALFRAVVDEASRLGVRRMDWQVLEWNTPAIEFYKTFHAILDPEWVNGRLFYNDIQKLKTKW
jgi:GNAT superfamily N-acetyltransferase